MPLTDQTIRLLLRLVALVLLLASAFLLWRAFSGPVLPKVSDKERGVAKPRDAVHANYTRTLDAFEPLFQLSLGAPLYDPPPKQAPEPKQPVIKEQASAPPKKKTRPVDVGLRVIGTVIESGKSLAIFADAKGSIQLRGEGESIETPLGSGKVDQIELQQVSISFDDETMTLKAP